MSCPNGSSLPTTLITTGLCIDDNTQSATYWVFTIVSGLLAASFFLLMLHTILYGRIVKNRIVIFGTVAAVFLFVMDLGFLLRLGFIVTTDALNFYAAFMLGCLLIVVEKWALVPTHLISKSDSKSIRKFIHIAFNSFNCVWWIPMLICWSFGNAHGQNNVFLAAGLMVAGIAAMIAGGVIFYVFRRIKYFIEKAVANAREINSSRNDLPKALQKINRFSWGVLVVIIPAGCVCFIAAAIIIHDGTIYVFYYIFMYVIHPLALGLLLPVFYVHLTTAKKAHADTQHTSSSFDQPLYPNWGICGSPVHAADEEQEASKTSSVEKQIVVINLGEGRTSTSTPAMHMLKITVAE